MLSGEEKTSWMEGLAKQLEDPTARSVRPGPAMGKPRGLQQVPRDDGDTYLPPRIFFKME